MFFIIRFFALVRKASIRAISKINHERFIIFLRYLFEQIREIIAD